MNLDTHPTSIGRYKILEEIGRGGFDIVYLAHDDELHRRVAVKISDHDTDDLQDFVRNEATTLAAMQHRAVMNIYDVGVEGRRTYAVLEYLQSSLEREIESGQISPQRFVSLFADVAEALDYVHRRGYLHRNIKPGVILVDALGQPKLSGFIIAVRQTDFKPDPERIVGTVHFIAPEQFERNRSLGPAADIWALGVTMYNALTGKLPFHASDPIKLMAAILMTQPEPPRSLNPSIPAELERICLKCLSKLPADRYQTGEALAAELRGWSAPAKPAERRVFVSHSGQDREFVESKIVALLERNGIRTRYSQADIQTASEWDRSILRGLESCDWFLLVMSRRAAESPWVKDELFWAIDQRPDRIIAVRIDDCDWRDFHIRLARTQNIDMAANPSDAERRLLDLLRTSSSLGSAAADTPRTGR